MSSGMQVSRIQKARGAALENTKSMPASSPSARRNMRPRSRCSAVRAISTSSGVAMEPTRRRPRSYDGRGGSSGQRGSGPLGTGAGGALRGGARQGPGAAALVDAGLVGAGLTAALADGALVDAAVPEAAAPSPPRARPGPSSVALQLAAVRGAASPPAGAPDPPQAAHNRPPPIADHAHRSAETLWLPPRGTDDFLHAPADKSHVSSRGGR